MNMEGGMHRGNKKWRDTEDSHLQAKEILPPSP